MKLVPHLLGRTAWKDGTSSRNQSRFCRILIPAGLLGIVFLFRLLPAAGEEPPPRPQTEAKLQVEVGIDSLERRYYRPRYVFVFALAPWSLVAEIDYNQHINGSLQGAIDYWLNLALQRWCSGDVRFEARINHMCRHQTSLYQANVFNLNEVLGRVWYLGEKVRAAVGSGFYAGGNAGYSQLLTFSLEIPRLFDTELGFSGQLTWTDFRYLFYEAEIFYPLGAGTALFLRQTRHYQFPDTTYIGLRIDSGGRTEKFLHSFRILTGVFPAYRQYKVMVNGDITLDFFNTDSRRVVTSVDFVGPILAGRSFFGSFWPDHMYYDVWLQLERKVGKSLYAAWYGKYAVDMPCDKEVDFTGDLGTGIAVRNQPDFERLSGPFRFEVLAGVNFKHDFDLIAKFGLNTLPAGKRTVLGVRGSVRSNRARTFAELRVFAEFGRRVTVRPFLGLDRFELFSGERLDWDRFMAGVEIGKWFK